LKLGFNPEAVVQQYNRQYHVIFEIFKAVTMNAAFWDDLSCGSCKRNVSEEYIASIIRVTRMDGVRGFEAVGW
jgi:hypothetical protein